MWLNLEFRQNSAAGNLCAEMVEISHDKHSVGSKPIVRHWPWNSIRTWGFAHNLNKDLIFISHHANSGYH